MKLIIDIWLLLWYTLKWMRGEVAEWSKAQHWKCCNGVSRSWVRIPSSPPLKMAWLCEKLRFYALSEPFIFLSAQAI